MIDDCEKLELKIRRHYSEWIPALCDLFAYSLAIGVPWVIGMWWLIGAVLDKL